MIDEAIASLIGRIHADSHDDAGLIAVLENVATVTGSATGVIARPRPAQGSLGEATFFGRLDTRHARGIEELATLEHRDPSLAFFARNPGAPWFDTAADLDADAHAASPYTRWHREWFGGTHWTVCHRRGDGGNFGVALHRGRPGEAHDARERTLFRMLFAQLAAAQATVPAAVTAVVGANRIVVDGTGAVRVAGETARVLLAAGDGVYLHDGVAAAEAPHQRRAFADLIASALAALAEGSSGGVIALERGSRRRALIATIRPAPTQRGIGRYAEGATIDLVDRDADADPTPGAHWHALWRLTPAGQALAATLLANGCDMRGAAEALAVSYATVRTQLSSILAKTECRGQPELMRLLTQVSG